MEGGAPQPAYLARQLDTAALRRNAELFTVSEDGVVVAVRKPDGSAATALDKSADADAWAVYFSQDFFWNQCSNHEHDCTETCVKYVKKKLEAKESLRSTRTPSCRFWFFRIIPLHMGGRLRRVRRRGKPLVREPFVDSTDDRNQRCRCQVKRDQPFRSSTNDVCQVSDRCNVDFQFLMCAPVEPTDVANEPQPGGASQPATAKQTPESAPQWLGGVLWRSLSSARREVVGAVSSAFRKMHAMDFYNTKCKRKMMQSMTPLFAAMTQGIRKLEEQEKQAEQLADKDPAEEPARKKRKTKVHASEQQ